MNILLVSTVGSNPGDDFIRLGQEYLLRQVLDRPVFTTVNKHDPRTLYEGFVSRTKPPHRLVSPLLFRFYRELYGERQTNRLEVADVVVFCGTPFIWRQNTWLFPSTSANAEWVTPIWDRLFTDLTNKPVLNLAAGTSLHTSSGSDRILRDQQVIAFLRKALSRSILTTSRDRYTSDILGSIGYEIPVLPCTSLWAAKGAGLTKEEPEYVVINVMPSAVHTARGKQVNAARWKKTITEIVPRLEKRYRILFVSHSIDEDLTVSTWFHGRERFYSNDPKALLKVYSKAYFGLCNRVHAAAGVATFGRPAIVIGGDSRVHLIDEFGLSAFDHRDIDVERLWAAVEELENTYQPLITNLRNLSEVAEKAYLAKLQVALNSPLFQPSGSSGFSNFV